MKYIYIKNISLIILGITLGFLISYNISNDTVGKKIYQKKEFHEKIKEGNLSKIPPKIFTIAELYDNTDIYLMIGEYLVIADDLSKDDIIFDSGVLKFYPGGTSGSYSTNPSFEALRVGNTSLAIKKENFNVSVNIFVSEQGDRRENEIIDINSGIRESQEIIAKIINKNKKEAISIIESADIRYRVVSEDGLSYQVTMDYAPSRINLEIIADKIVNATLG